MIFNLSTEVFAVLIISAFLSGAVRGFAGFGDALVFLPLAGIFIEPLQAIIIFMIMGAVGPLPMMKSAWQEADKDLLKQVNIPMLIALPFGYAILAFSEPSYVRVLTSSIAIIASVLLIAGWRPKFIEGAQSRIILGIICGIVGGATGVPGAALIFYFLCSALTGAQIRANISIILIVFDVAILLASAGFGELTISLVLIGIILLPAYVLGNWIGKSLFNPNKERLLRRLGLATVFLSGIIGMPYGLFF